MKIKKEILDRMIQHARKDAPIEACGYLAEKDGIVSETYPLKNVDASPEHFNLDPAEQFSTIRKIRMKKLRLRAVYHSHPNSPARPSEEDIRLAYDPSISYVIVALMGIEATVKSFAIRSGVVTDEEIIIDQER